MLTGTVLSPGNRIEVTLNGDGTYTLGSTVAERFLALSIAAARKRLYLTNAYFFPNRHFVDLLTAAAERGVDVRLLTAGPHTDIQLVRLAGRAWYEQLLNGGVRLYVAAVDAACQDVRVDGTWSSIGSMNLDNRSLALNDEATLLVLDRRIGIQMEEIFLDDLRDSEEITAAASVDVRGSNVSASTSVTSSRDGSDSSAIRSSRRSTIVHMIDSTVHRSGTAIDPAVGAPATHARKQHSFVLAHRRRGACHKTYGSVASRHRGSGLHASLDARSADRTS
jgi:hypothetical protein